MADAITSALLKEADAFGGAKNPGPMMGREQLNATAAQLSAAGGNTNLPADAARIRAAELQPNGGGMLPRSAAVDAPPPDPITAALLKEAGPTAQRPTQAAPKQPKAPTPAEEGGMSASEVLTTAARNLGVGPGGIIKAATALRQPLAEVGKSVGTGLASSVLGGLAGMYTLITNGMDTEKAADTVREVQDKLTYQPKGEGAKAGVELLGSNANPLNWIPNAANAVGEAGVKSGVLSPGEATALSTAATMVAPGAALKALGKGGTALKNIGKAGAAEEAAPFGSVGAAAANKGSALKQELTMASPELQQAAKSVPDKHLNPVAVKRQVEADSLPVPVRLTAGQATGDLGVLSNEMNSRGKSEALRNRYQEQNQQLKDNLNAIREEAAPDVFGTNHVENGQALIDAYKATDSAITKDISAKYKALEDANGGNFPIDGIAFADAAEKALAKKLKTDFLPPAIAKQLAKFKEGEPMNFEQFEAMRTNLASEIRKAERSGDGNAAYASGLVRESLEDLPLTGEAAKLKPLADAARSAAKARFDLLKKDPAYKAAVNETTAADDFINKFVVKGKAADVKQMAQHLGVGSPAHQTMSAGAINYLKQKAGIVNEAGNFSQAGYNKALQELKAKLVDIVGGKAAKQLETVGNVARYTQEQPRGSFVNNSNTFVAQAAEKAKDVAEVVANKFTGGVGGTVVRSAVAKKMAEKDAMKSLQTGAGIDLRDIGKK